MWFNNEDSLVLRNDLFHLLCAQDGNSTLVEAVWIFLGGDVEVNGENEVRPGEVQVNGQSHLQGEDQNKMKTAKPKLLLLLLLLRPYVFLNPLKIQIITTKCI